MKKILLIDDSKTQLLTLKLFLTKNNFEVITAENGIEGYKKVIETPPDLIICDVMMPNLNGYQFCRLLKNNPLTQSLPIILLTSLNQNIDKFWGKQAGADLFLSKNYEFEHLLEQINITINNFPVQDGIKKTIANTQALKNALQSKINDILDTSLMEATIMNEFRKLSKNIENSEKFLVNFFKILSSMFSYNICALNFYDDTFSDKPKFYVSTENYKYSQEFLEELVLIDEQTKELMTIEIIEHAEDKKENSDNKEFKTEYCLDLQINEKKLAKLCFYSYEIVDYENFQFFETVKNEIALMAKIRNLYAQTKYLSITDGLTSLYNRRYFFENIEREFERSRRYKSDLSIAMLDIDYFKHINDTYGHQAGDLVLKDLARILTKTLRKTDLIFRYGGEEIIILLPETSLYQALIPLERLRKIIEKRTIQYLDKEFNYTTSIGIAEKTPEIITNEELIAHADKALYKAKNSGRNKVELYEQ
ncbi:diguanylate cyclase [bacterium]|nr:diguanylate cyclase [bacterium]